MITDIVKGLRKSGPKNMYSKKSWVFFWAGLYNKNTDGTGDKKVYTVNSPFSTSNLIDEVLTLAHILTKVVLPLSLKEMVHIITLLTYIGHIDIFYCLQKHSILHIRL